VVLSVATSQAQTLLWWWASWLFFPRKALSLVWSNRETETQTDKVICQEIPVDLCQNQEESTGLLSPCLIHSPVSRGQLKTHA